MKQKRAILLLAVSSGKQAAELRQSLPEQDERLHEIAAHLGWKIVDIITVPGHSRVYYTYREFAEEALAEGIAAPMRMFEHWQKRDFDVFACASGDRFGREQSIFAEVVGRTIDAGAVVHTLRDGEINAGNRRMFVSMGGYQASVEIDELKRRYRFGMKKRAARGLPTTSHGHIYSHAVVGQGDSAQTVVNDSARRLFADIADLLLQGVSWRQMPDLLLERGHARPSGRRLSPSTLRGWLMHPTFWGNTAQHFHDGDHYSVGRGFWVFDSSEPAPPHVTIYYNTHPPMYAGELAQRVQAELRRRFGATGNSRPLYRRRFGGLVVCGECGYACNYKQSDNWLGIHCVSRQQVDLDTRCTNIRYINEKRLIALADAMLRDMLASGNWSALYAAGEQDDTADRLAQVEAELEAARGQVTALIQKQASMPAVLSDTYDAQIRALAARLEGLQTERARLAKTQADAAPQVEQKRALEELRLMGVDALWLLPPHEVNMFLSRLFGTRRLVLLDGDIIGMSAAPRLYKLPMQEF